MVGVAAIRYSPVLRQEPGKPTSSWHSGQQGAEPWRGRSASEATEPAVGSPCGNGGSVLRAAGAIAGLN